MTTFMGHESLNVISNFSRDSVKEATATEGRESFRKESKTMGEGNGVSDTEFPRGPPDVSAYTS